MESKGLPIILVCVKTTALRHFFYKELGKNCEVIEADDLEDAAERVKNTKLDLIILDDAFGEEKLIGCLQIARRLTRCSILVITQSLKKDYHRKVIVAGASDFLSVPLDPVELAKQIDKLKKIEVIDKKMGALASQFPSLPLKQERRLTGFIVNDAAVSFIKECLAQKKSICAFLFQLEKYEDSETKWVLLDEALPREGIKIITLAKGKRLALMKGLSEEKGKALGTDLRKSTPIQIGFFYLTGHETASPKELFDQILEAAEANQL